MLGPDYFEQEYAKSPAGQFDAYQDMRAPLWIDPHERAHMLWETLTSEIEKGTISKDEFLRVIGGALRLADGAARGQCVLLIRDLSDDIKEDICKQRTGG